MKRWTWIGCVGALALGMWGCGDEVSTSGSSSSSSTSTSTSTSSSSGAMDEYAQYCQADYDRDVKCGNMPLPTQVETCKTMQACDEALFRDGVLPGIHTCVVERDCMTGDDACYAAASDAQPDTASSMAYGTGCTMKLMECTTAGTPFPDDYCFSYKLVKDSVLDEMTACFSNTCDMVSACLSGVKDKIYAACPK